MELTVCTFNLRHDNPQDGTNRWEHRRGLVGEVWCAARWDIVGMQEVLAHQLTHLREALPDYDHVGVGREDGQAAGEHCPIFFRADRFAVMDTQTFWLSDSPETPGSRTWGHHNSRLCTAARFVEQPTGRAFWVFNTHTDHESQFARERSSGLLKERLAARAPADPALMTGDFNADPANPAITALTAAGPPVLRDVYAEVHPGDDSGSFHGFLGQAPPGRIDYIFAGPEWQVLDARIVRDSREGVFLTDHFPVATHLRLI